ncbi:MAG: hypothetical protein OEM60_05355 [Gammaproteobacteria bacterium]|nr:hypothetical protein [Gammaproteobacteria bacterium]MDH3429844.1 hypothetical protein [Gammaproteobacteria bacterium]MDH3433261.1 hypothetical protein [Gammaproteobacteria bacterium]
MTGGDYVILVVNRTKVEAENLKELIEFMDAPNVRTSEPGDWRRALGDSRLEALFVGPDLSSDEVNVLLADIGEFDPNVPIVMMNDGAAA